MALLSVSNVKIVGISACVPSFIDENIESSLASKKDMQKLISSIGVERKRIADDHTCTSDLCYEAAKKLIDELNWDRREIECLFFVSQTPDYILPATSCVLQDRLGLSEECYTTDISLGCSGWVYGLSAISSIMSSGKIKKGLLLVGDTTSKTTSRLDKSSWPLFGDAGTATAIEYSQECSELFFHLATDGSSANAIVIPDGGYRNNFSANSLILNSISEGVQRNKLHTILDGMNVFSFAITKVPKSIKRTLEFAKINSEDVDFYLLHQANFFLNETIRKKLKLELEKTPYSLKNFGNTSCATIPLTLVSENRNDLINKNLKLIGCGFGVGLSWGTVYFETDKIICPPLIEY